MSSICGMIHFDGTPVDPQALHKMAEAVAYSGPDGTRYWISQNAGFAHLALHTTPEAPFERQPLRDPQNGLIWMADARIDNREELIDLFTKSGDIQGDAVVTDVELLMLAYRRWGEDFLPKIYGNYAFVMWDPARQRVLAGRDFLGLRPMFHMRQGQTVYFASAIRSILAVLPEKPPLNELLIADYYRYNFDRWIAETIYMPIRRLPAACMLTLDATQENLKQHWMITNAPILRYKNDQEYYDQFLDLFQTAIKACARTDAPLGIQVSGGIDSSSIACTLHKMWVENEFGSIPPSVKLYYMHHANDPCEEEIQYHDAVVKACPQFSSTVIPGENYWGLQEIGNENGYHLDEPEMHVARSLITARLQRSQIDGCKVVMRGIGGDELFQIYFTDMDLLRDLPFSCWLEAVQSYHHLDGFPGILKLAGQSLLRGIGLQPIWSKLRDNSSLGSRMSPLWLRIEWAQPVMTTPIVFKMAIPDNFCSELQRIRQTALFTRGFYLSILESGHRHAIENGTEICYPFLDRRVIDFVFQLPTGKLMDFNFSLKPFLKASMLNILPEVVMRRTNKSIIDPTINLGLRSQESLKVGRLLENARKYQARYVDFLVYNKMWNAFIAGKEYPGRALFVPLILQAWIEENNLLL